MRGVDAVNIKLSTLEKDYSFVENYFVETGLQKIYDREKSVDDIAAMIESDYSEDYGIDSDVFIQNFINFFDSVVELLGLSDDDGVKSITIQAGFHKDNTKEQFGELCIRRGDIVSIVGPTGSGKSRLLADIEWAADRDTPTKRRILVNGEVYDKGNRFSTSNKLVAQLSQNMNFVMDLTVYEFLEMHAVSRLVENKEEVINKIFYEGNKLAGERFDMHQSITSLSGGQSRALMIADTSILSKSPIILIDEIENAGINRKKALDLLIREDKIVLMATHDPILALMADKRIIISNGGITKVIETTEAERRVLDELNELDKRLSSYRTKLRYGELLD